MTRRINITPGKENERKKNPFTLELKHQTALNLHTLDLGMLIKISCMAKGNRKIM